MKSFLFSLCCIFCLSACIQEDIAECPTPYTIQLFVKDKNYFNEAQLLVDNDLPFRQYVSGIYYVLHNTETGENSSSPQYIPIQGDQTGYQLTLDGVPNGHYKLIVWGNLPNASVISGLTANLHPNMAESTDMYIGTTTFDLAPHTQTASLDLERAKGKLRIICKNFPDSITQVDVRISNISQKLENNLYSGTTDIKKSFPLSNVTNPILETYVAPTFSGNTSNLVLTVFANHNIQPIFTITAINTIIKRNEISSIEINFNTVNHTWEIWLFLDNEWTMVSHLVLE